MIMKREGLTITMIFLAESASHGFPCFMVEQTVQIIEGFIQPIV